MRCAASVLVLHAIWRFFYHANYLFSHYRHSAIFGRCSDNVLFEPGMHVYALLIGAKAYY
jgi:hypothetical protein